MFILLLFPRRVIAPSTSTCEGIGYDTSSSDLMSELVQLHKADAVPGRSTEATLYSHDGKLRDALVRKWKDGENPTNVDLNKNEVTITIPDGVFYQKWHVTEYLGRGSTGTVYLAEESLPTGFRPLGGPRNAVIKVATTERTHALEELEREAVVLQLPR